MRPGVCLSQGNPDLGDCAFEPGSPAREARASFDAARAADVGAVDAAKWFCADGRCPSVVGRYITMRDSEHVTPDYARWIAPSAGGRSRSRRSGPRTGRRRFLTGTRNYRSVVRSGPGSAVTLGMV